MAVITLYHEKKQLSSPRLPLWELILRGGGALYEHSTRLSPRVDLSLFAGEKTFDSQSPPPRVEFG